MYLPVPLGSFSLVAVFPPILQPSMAHFDPPPSATTASSISRIFCDVSSSITCLCSSNSMAVIVSLLLSIILFPKCGVTVCPPFTTVHTADMNCIGVTWNDCPNDMVASSTGPTFSFLCMMEFASPGRSIPL